jgi:hypothetical protein
MSFLGIAVALLVFGRCAVAAEGWIRPSGAVGAEPVWGFEKGIRVGLWPVGGPRGLIRVYAPYGGVEPPRVINFISVEPVARGSRGQSELETGLESARAGLEFRTADTMDEAAHPRSTSNPAPGRIEMIDGQATLTFFIVPEPFRNGSRPIVQVLLRKDRPREVTFRVFAAAGSAPMNACVLSATMGNYARLRRVWLWDQVAEASRVWPVFEPDALGFAPWKVWPRERLLRKGDELVVAATSDEADPELAAYEPGVNVHWHYQGRPATQYWRTGNAGGARAQVNGRITYWGSSSRIPGGVAYENFEVEAPFRAGQEFTFGVTPDGPERLGFRLPGGTEWNFTHWAAEAVWK